MPYASHRTRYVVIVLLLTWLGLVFLSRPAHGGWNTYPAQVHPTSALCPLVSVSDEVGDMQALELPGTAELPSGIYFASSSRDGVEGNTKTVVIH